MLKLIYLFLFAAIPSWLGAILVLEAYNNTNDLKFCMISSIIGTTFLINGMYNLISTAVSAGIEEFKKSAKKKE